MVNSVASLQEGPGFDPQVSQWSLFCLEFAFSLAGFPQGAQVSSNSHLATLNCPNEGVNGFHVSALSRV